MWRKSNEIFTHDQHSGPTVVFAGDGTSGGPPHYPPVVWNTIDLKPLGVSADATFAEITGFLIITDGGSEIDNLTACFRPPGSTLNEGNYQMQAISVWAGGGERHVQCATVGLVDGCFQFFWRKEVGGAPESGHPTAFLLNLWLTKWGRDLPAGADQSAAIAALQSTVADLQSRVSVIEQGQPPSSPLPPDMTIQVPMGGLNVRLVQA